MKKDIENLKDIQYLVDAFYAKVKLDSFIGPFFNSRLEGRWEMHHRKLYRFWHTVLLRRPDYFGDPVPMHLNMALTRDHFDQWLMIWTETIDEMYEGEIAERAKFRGKTMANAFYNQIRRTGSVI